MIEIIDVLIIASAILTGVFVIKEKQKLAIIFLIVALIVMLTKFAIK